MPYRRSLAVAITAYFLGLAIAVYGPWEQLSKLLSPSDDEIASFMSGTPTSDSFHPADAPDTHFPENLWNTDPKAAALAFADANRTAAHRKLYKLIMDENPAIKAPEKTFLGSGNHRDFLESALGAAAEHQHAVGVLGVGDFANLHLLVFGARKAVFIEGHADGHLPAMVFSDARREVPVGRCAGPSR